MNLIRYIFPDLASKGSATAGQLGTGASPELANYGKRAQTINKYSVLPDNISRSDLLDVNKEAARSAAQAVLDTRYSSLAIQAAENNLKGIETALAHSESMMEIESKVISAVSKHGKAVQRFALSRQLKEESYSMYSRTLQSAENLLSDL
jgi:hypothetical protein